jgi:hypothetical protein
VRTYLLALILLLGACDSGEPTEASLLESPDPAAVVEQWFEAVANVDGEGLGSGLVEPIGLAVVAGVENRVRSSELVALVESGVEGQLADGYWRSFRDNFEVFRGVDIAEIIVGDEQRIPLPDHVAVEVGTSDQSALVLLRASELVGWQIDMVATFGPGLVGQLRQYLESALNGQYAEPIAEAYRFAVIPGLDAALAVDPGNTTLVFETEFIRQLLEV